MAVTSSQLPSPIHVKSHQRHLPAAIYPSTSSSKPVQPEAMATEWIATLNKALQNKDFHIFNDLFFEESYWRDQLCLSWDYHTLNGPQMIRSFLERHVKGSRLRHLAIDDSDLFHVPKTAFMDSNQKILGVQAFLKIETDVGNGRGLVRLLQDRESENWKAFTLFTAMYELKGHGEAVKHRRPLGLDHQVPGEIEERTNWQEKRFAEENFKGTSEPTVLIIGKRSK